MLAAMCVGGVWFINCCVTGSYAKEKHVELTIMETVKKHGMYNRKMIQLENMPRSTSQ